MPASLVEPPSWHPGSVPDCGGRSAYSEFFQDHRARLHQLSDVVIPFWEFYAATVRIIAKRTLRTYWEKERRAEQPLRSWHAIATAADWASPADVKAVYGNASVVGNDRIVFNIAGNRYRLIVRFDFRHRIGFVRFVGTHADYDQIDASNA